MCLKRAGKSVKNTEPSHIVQLTARVIVQNEDNQNFIFDCIISGIFSIKRANVLCE